MSSIADFRQQLKVSVEDVEHYRLDLIKKVELSKYLFLIPILLCVIGTVFTFFNDFAISLLFFFVGIIIYLMIVFLIVNRIKIDYAKVYKEKIFSSFFSMHFPEFTFDHQDMIAEDDFKASELFGSYGLYQGEDLILGICKNRIQYQMSELEIYHENNDKKTKTRTNTHPNAVFIGLFFVMDLPFELNGRLKIYPNNTENSLDKDPSLVLQDKTIFFKNNSAVHLDKYPDFDRGFNIYMDQALQKKEIFSDKLLELICNVRFKWDANIKISFKGKKLYVALPLDKDLFDPNIHHSLLNNNLLNKFNDELSLCLTLAEDISQSLIIA